MTERLPIGERETEGLRDAFENPEAANQKAERRDTAEEKLERLIRKAGEHVNACGELGDIEEVPCEVVTLLLVEPHQWAWRLT